ncbi:MAG: restriction endonuclease subunit S [Vulcanimicrobiota bacterium]
MINVLPATYGIRWLDGIPAHWQIARSKRLFTQRKEKARASDQQLTASQEFGVIPQAHFMEKAGRQVVQVFLNPEILNHVEEGDFVISMRSFQGGLEVAKATGCISSAYVVLKPSETVHRGFFSYLFKSARYIQALQSTSNLVRDGQALRFENFAMVDLPLLPLKEQQAIANFLDRKTAAIDALIEKKQKLVELLAEKRAALINQAVTKGLDPNVPMKDSGIPWIGQIPEGWAILPAKAISLIYRGRFSHRPRDDERLYGGIYPFLQTGSIARAAKYITEHTQTLNDWGKSVSKEFPVGTLVMAIAANVGDIAITTFPACFPDSVVGFAPRNVHLDFLYYVFLAMRAELSNIASENTQKNLNIDLIGALRIPLPSKAEQIQIVGLLGRLDETYFGLTGSIRAQIDYLKEYRQALITAAVTGQLEIPEAPQ